MPTLSNTIQGNMFPSLKTRSPGSGTALRKSLFRLLANQEKPIVRYAVGIFSIDRDQSSAGALINCSYRVSRYLESSVRYHPLTSSPMDFEPEVFAFALAYAE